MAPRKNARGNRVLVITLNSTNEDDNETTTVQQESLVQQPPSKRSRKGPSTSRGKEATTLPILPVALPEQGQRLTRGLLKRIIESGSVTRRSELITTGLEGKQIKTRRVHPIVAPPPAPLELEAVQASHPKSVKKTKSSASLKSGTKKTKDKVHVGDAEPSHPEPVEDIEMAVSTSNVKEDNVNANKLNIPAPAPVAELVEDVRNKEHNVVANEFNIPVEELTDVRNQEDKLEVDVYEFNIQADELEKHVQNHKPQDEGDATGTSDSLLEEDTNPALFYSFEVGNSNVEERNHNDSVPSVYNTPTGPPIRHENGNRQGAGNPQFDRTYVIRNAAYHEIDSEVPEADHSVGIMEYSLQEPRRPRDNYNITLFDDYDADDMRYRETKPKPKWAATADTIISQAHLCRPDLLKLVPKYSTVIGGGIFPAPHPHQKLFPDAVPRLHNYPTNN